MEKVLMKRTGENKELLNVKIKDSTGVIPVSLWGKHAQRHSSLKVGDCISLEKGEKALFQSQPTINTWEDSTVIAVSTMINTEDLTK